MSSDPYSPRQAGGGKTRKQATRSELEEAGAPAGGANVAADQLRGFVERIERLEEDKKEIADDIKSVFAEAKAHGFDTKVLRRVIAIRKQDQNERAEFEAVLDTYLSALGMGPAPE